MAVSGINIITTIETVRSLAAFSNGVDLYALWTAQNANAACCRTIIWRKHGDGPTNDVRADMVRPYEQASAVIRHDGSLAVVYVDSSYTFGNIWVAFFNLSTGAVIGSPLQVATGSSPLLTLLPFAKGVARLSLVYLAKSSVRIRESLDGGLTWCSERPVLNAKVRDTEYVAVAPFDASHASIMQVGSDTRIIREVSSLSRTRPVVGILPHPTQSGKFYVVESVHRTVTAVEQISDNERGYLSILADGKILTSSRVRVGTADGLGDVMLVDCTGSAPVISASAVAPSGATPGAEVVTVLAEAAGPGAVLASSLFGASSAAAVDVVSGASYGYFAGYTDQATDGALAVMRLSDNTTALPLTGMPVRCIDLKQGLLVVATKEDGLDKVRFYSENGFTPTLLATHLLPARANVVSLRMTDATHGLLYVSAVDRLNIYEINGLTNPIQLRSSFRILTIGSFFQHQDIAITGGGYIVAAIGNGGIAVYNTQGETLAQIPLSGVSCSSWSPGQVVAINALVRPTASNFYAAQRKYFKCTTGGTTGTNEPNWAPYSALVPDNTAVWQEVGPYEGVVTGVALDEPRQHIVAVGLAGGPSGNAGKIWIIDASQVLPQ